MLFIYRAWIHVTKIHPFSEKSANDLRSKHAKNNKLQRSIGETLAYIREMRKQVENHMRIETKQDVQRVEKRLAELENSDETFSEDSFSSPNTENGNSSSHTTKCKRNSETGWLHFEVMCSEIC